MRSRWKFCRSDRLFNILWVKVDSVLQQQVGQSNVGDNRQLGLEFQQSVNMLGRYA